MKIKNTLTKKYYYFSYGMNTDPEQMKLRTGAPTPIGRGCVRDHAFRFAHFADVYPKDGVTTHGVLWQIDEEQLASLDIREGYPYYYLRKEVEVECGGTTYMALMYYMTPGHPDYPPSNSYHNMLISGYSHFNVPQQQIVDAIKSANNSPEAVKDEKKYRDERSDRVYSAYSVNDYASYNNYQYVSTGKKTRWFDTYEQLVKCSVSKKKFKHLCREAQSSGLSMERYCQDAVEYIDIRVPDHFQVRDAYAVNDDNYYSSTKSYFDSVPF